MNPLRELQKYHQSVWLDYIRRDLVIGGELERLVTEDGLRGVTSNPTIFEKAIAGSSDYDRALSGLVAQDRHLDSRALYEDLAVKDVQMAADVLKPVFIETEGIDGYVSLELSRDLARDTTKSVEEARRLWKIVDRPNLMIKVPATPEGIPVFESLIAEGINVNVTLMFSVGHYEAVSQAYLKGLGRCPEPHKIASVASFFVSRVDTVVDKALEGIGTPAALSLRGKIAIANSKLVYKKFKEVFGGDGWKALEKNGARVQRPLWASTGTKNPAYSDVLYVEELIGPQTVNTLPPGTLNAFRDHGRVSSRLEEGLEQAEADLKTLADMGVALEPITTKLQEERVAAFAGSFKSLLSAIEEKRYAILQGERTSQSFHLGEFQPRLDERLASWGKKDFSRRLWAKDPSLWAPPPTAEITNRLGWLALPELMHVKLDELVSFAEEIKSDGFTQVVLLGMGGSSLASEVFQKTFGNRPGFPDLRVLDSTHPEAVASLEKQLDLSHTLFLVSSKSGTTLETLSFFRYFWSRVGRLIDIPGHHFVAITDSGTPLVDLARKRKFRRIFPAHSEVGGRYSALTEFGLVPASLIGMDVYRLLDRAWTAAENNAFCVPEENAAGFVLGAALGEVTQKKNKLTIFTSPSLRSFPDWLEQLIAESTGKDGKGIVPIANEPFVPIDSYGLDRVFVSLVLENDDAGELEGRMKALENAGHPIIRIRLKDRFSLGQEIFRWEIAIASVGAVLGIHPFNQPDVEMAKILARQAMSGEKDNEKKTSGILDTISVHDLQELGRSFKNWISSAGRGAYLALQAYLAPKDDVTQALQKFRLDFLTRTRLATTFGYGPRFLHSTGQLHKGGPNEVLVLQLVDEPLEDIEVPETDYSFNSLIQAQSLGDFQALVQRDRRVLRVNLGSDVLDGLEKIRRII